MEYFGLMTRGLVITPRSEIVDQWVATARELGLSASGWTGNRKDGSGNILCTTMASAGVHLDSFCQGIDFLLFDEAHHAMSMTGRNIFDAARHYNPNVKVLFLTATIDRSDGEKLEWLLSTNPVVVTSQEALLGNALMEHRVIEVTPKLALDEAGVKCLLDLRARNGKADRATVFFVDRVSQIEMVVRLAQSRGITVAGLSGKTPAAERRRILADYMAGRITMLVNVGILTEGVDLNHTEVVILVSQPATRTPYIQKAGRSLGRVKGKEEPLIIINGPRADVGLSVVNTVGRYWPQRNAKRGGPVRPPYGEEREPYEAGIEESELIWF
jgi:superfamily II DNA or RNA helicase